MSAAPRVTVITVVRNCLAELTRTRASVAFQDFAGVDHLVIDGASTDGTPEWLASIDDPRLTWVSEPDDGIYQAMNKGVAMARGAFVVFMNAGDTFRRPDVLTRWNQLQWPSGALWTYSKAVFVDEVGRATRPPYGLARYSTRRHAYSRLAICHQAVMMSRDLLLDAGGFNPDFGHVADYALLLKVGRSHRPLFIESVDVNYLDGGVSAINPKMAEEKHAARVEVLELGPVGHKVDTAYTSLSREYWALRRWTKRKIQCAGGGEALRHLAGRKL